MKFRKDGEILVVFFEREENFSEKIDELLLNENFPPTMIITSSLGMVKDVEMGYGKYENEKVSYEKEVFAGPFELLGMSGIIQKNIKPQFHIHILLGDKNKNSLGGHLFDLKVHTFIEMYLISLDKEIKRKWVNGLFSLDL